MVLQKRVIIGQADLTRIIDELERRAASADFYAMRTRAFVYLLADGVLRTNAAISLNLEDVVKDPAAKRIRVVQEAVQRPCEANRYKARKFVMTDRTRDAIAQYLEVARAEGWLPERALKGPLFIATEHRGTMQRLSQRTATSLWRTFLGDVKVGHDYQLEDIVFTARVRFLQLAKGNLDVFSEHTGLSRHGAAVYREHLLKSPSSSLHAVLSELNRRQSQK